MKNKDLASKLENLETSVKETTQKLDEVTKDYEQKEKQLRNRLVALYEAGPILYIDVLLSSKTLSDFISRYYKILEIMEYDNKLIETVEQEKKEIELSKQKIR